MDNRRQSLRVVIIVLCLYLILTAVQGITGLMKAGDKVTEREKQLATLQEERRKLMAEQNKVGSEEYLQEVAYDQLGLVKPGEKVVVVPKELLDTGSKSPAEPQIPNWQKWLKLLTG